MRNTLYQSLILSKLEVVLPIRTGQYAGYHLVLQGKRDNMKCVLNRSDNPRLSEIDDLVDLINRKRLRFGWLMGLLLTGL